MEVVNCIKCGRLFYNISEVLICPECRKLSEDKIREVENYIEENRDASLEQVSEACHVEQEQVERWIKNERVKYSTNASHKVTCENCGALIHSGKMCENCRKKKAELIQRLSKELSGSGPGEDSWNQ